MSRVEFTSSVRDLAAKRVGLRCSNPECQRLTCGPATDSRRSISIGEAAHISAASPGGPRYDNSISSDQRCSIENAIWLCAACATLIDRDELKYTVQVLTEWRIRAENAARSSLRAGTVFRPIAASEVIQELTIEQVVAIKELEEEFACHVEWDVHIPANDGWIHFDAAVVRGEDLIAIELGRFHGNGYPFFQIEHLVELCQKAKFHRFAKCALYVVVVSDGSQEAAYGLELRLRELGAASLIEMHIRMYRLNPLRAKFGI